MKMMPVVLTRKEAEVPAKPWPLDPLVAIKAALPFEVEPGQMVLVPTGLAIMVPEDMIMSLRPTAPMWAQDIEVFPQPIFRRSSDEPHEMHVEVKNRGTRPFSIAARSEIAMATFIACLDLPWRNVGTRIKS